MEALTIVALVSYLACLAAQGADCIITDISTQAGMIEANRFMAWAVKLRWPSYLIKFGVPTAAFAIYHELALYSNAKWNNGNGDFMYFCAYLLFVAGAVQGGVQAYSDWKAYKAFKASKTSIT